MTWLEELCGVKKPIIAMCHLQPLPGDPEYDKHGGMDKVLDYARKDLHALQEGNVDTIMFSNEFSFPYQTKVDTITVAAMAEIIGELKKEIKVPFGVDCQYDANASIDLALATGASYMREIITGTYASDFGLWNTDPSTTLRYRNRIGADHVKILFSINPSSAAKYMADRDLVSIAKSLEFNFHPDTLCVAGLPGDESDEAMLKEIKASLKRTPIVCDAGCNAENIVRRLRGSDGAVVATSFKKDGIFENLVDVKRVQDFMDVVNDYRKSL